MKNFLLGVAVTVGLVLLTGAVQQDKPKGLFRAYCDIGGRYATDRVREREALGCELIDCQPVGRFPNGFAPLILSTFREPVGTPPSEIVNVGLKLRDLANVAGNPELALGNNHPE